MSNEMVLFGGNGQGGPMQLPAHLQGQGVGTTGALMAAIGDQRNRIGLKGNRFRQVVAGQELGVWDENYLDIIIVGVVPTVSRIYYANQYSQQGDNQPPTCYSVNNIVPEDDVHQKQSDKCATCPQNIKGSRISNDGTESKACGYFRRLAVMLPGDDTLYVLDVKSMGIFGESYKERGLFSLNDYAKFLNANGVDASNLVTRISFDTNQSVPKLLFKAARYIDELELSHVRSVSAPNESGKSEVDEYLTINMKTVDISKEQTTEQVEEVAEYEETVQTEPAPAPRQAAPAPRQAAPATRPAPAQTQAAPQRQAAPAQRQAAPQQAAPQRQAAPAQRQAAPAQRQAAPAQNQAAPQRQAAPAQRQAAPAAQKPAAPTVNRPAPRTQQATLPIDDGVPQEDAVPVEVGSDDEMQSILSDLGL